MNKSDFLKRLDKELGILDNEEKKQILDFYEERFYTGTIYENKTEEEVISELESPEVIARNVLEEYGVSPKFVRTKEERYIGVDPSKLIILVLFDLFIVSWLLPTLYSVTISIFTSLLSYVGVVGLLIGAHTAADEYLFVFATGGYIILFIFGLLVLELSIYATKMIVIYHMNVLKYKNRDKVTKKLHRYSVEGWLKRHKFANRLKNIMFVGALVIMLYSGYHLFFGDINLINEYSNQPQTTDVYTEDLSADILADETWEIVVRFDSKEVEIIPVLGTELIITHKYEELNNFEIDIDSDSNTLTLVNVDTTQFHWADFRTIFYFFGNRDSIVIEVPIDMLLGDVDIQVYNGEIELFGVEVGQLDINASNGKISLDEIIINDDVTIYTSNGEINIQEVTGTYDLSATTSNGRIYIKDVEFTKYYLDTSNGSIILKDLNVINYDGVLLSADTSNGNIDLEDVYVLDVSLDTSNGNIEYFNSDSSFEVDNLNTDTSNGNISTNMD